MTTVSQLIEYLQTLPEDFKVHVAVKHDRDWYSFTEFVPLKLPTEDPGGHHTDIIGDGVYLGEI